MSVLSKLKISQKLPLIITGLAVVGCILTGFILIRDASKVAHHEAEEKLVALQASRASALETYLNSIREDLTSLAYNDYVAQALLDFNEGYQQITLESNPVETLQRLYIEENEHELGNKHMLDYAPDGSLYSQVHKHYHPWFRHFLIQRDYYDIFLFNTDGELVYTVFKELDYATNLQTGKYKETDLGNAFRAALESKDKDGQFFFDFKPYAPSHGAAASFISQPIIKNGRVLGVLVFQMPIGRINAIMQVSEGMGESGETYIVGEDHYMRSDSRFSEESTILKTKVDGPTVDAGLANENGVEVVMDYRGIEVVSAYGPFDFLGTHWAILAEIDEAEVQKPIKKMQMFALLAVVGIAAAIAIISILISKTISGPISNMTEAMNELANDHLDVEIPGVERADEIGTMAAAVQVFKENSINAKRLQAEQEAAEQRSAEERKKVLNDLADQFDQQVGSAINELADAAASLQMAAQGMESTAGRTQEASTTVASAAEETSANVATVSSASEEMAASAQEISKQVADVASKASQASTSATDTSRQVDELNSLVDNIGEVVVSIKDIAEQTNLLALNATIEAARAGEAGKGFAVVAEEVKKLASETSQKTEEIEGRIIDIQNATQASVRAMQLIIDNIADIDQSSSGTSAAAEEQNSVIAEITRSITEVSDAARQVANSITTVQSAANEAGQSSQSLNEYAANITSLSENLKKSVTDFLAEIRG